MREVQDHWFRKAKDEGYRSRAAYKLLEIDERKRLLRRGARVLDAGAAPGSWIQVVAERVGPQGEVVAIDLKPIDPTGLPRGVRLVEGDLTTTPLEELGGRPFDVIVSDMAPDTTGDPSGDHFRSARLCHTLLDRAPDWLRRGGNLVMKVFEGSDYPELLKRAGRLFEEAKGFKPKASRPESVEMYIVCHGYRGTPAAHSAAEGEGEADPHAPPRRKPSAGWGRR